MNCFNSALAGKCPHLHRIRTYATFTYMRVTKPNPATDHQHVLHMGRSIRHSVYNSKRRHLGHHHSIAHTMPQQCNAVKLRYVFLQTAMCGIVRQLICTIYEQPWHKHCQMSAFNSVLFTQYTCNMEACYYTDVSSTTAPHAYSSPNFPAEQATTQEPNSQNYSTRYQPPE